MESNNSNRVPTGENKNIISFDLPHELHTLESPVLIVLLAYGIKPRARCIVGHHAEVVGFVRELALHGHHRKSSCCVELHSCPGLTGRDFDEVRLGVVRLRVVAQNRDHASLN